MSAPSGPGGPIRRRCGFRATSTRWALPAQLPVIVRMASDWTGRVWVQRSGADPWTRGPTDVIAPDARYLGTLPPSAPGVPDAFGPDGLGAWIEKDELDAPVIVVRRAPPQLRR